MTDPAARNARTIAEFRAKSREDRGCFAGAPPLRLHTTRSAASRTNPMMYPADEGRYFVFAAKAGSDRNPDRWLATPRQSPPLATAPAPSPSTNSPWP
jgi:hypothetical protein